jgi:hypothetical protein
VVPSASIDPSFVTPESIATGRHLEVARFTVGRRAYLFLAYRKRNDVAFITANLDDHGHIVEILGCTRFSAHRLVDLERAVATARGALESTAA